MPADAIGERAQAADLARRRCLHGALRSVLEQQVENPERRRLRERTGVADRSDAPRTAVLALALGDQPPRAVEQLVVHAEQRLR